MTTLTNAEIAAIRDRYKQCVHESDYADLAEHIPALLDTIAKLREALGWYAEPRNYYLGVPGTWDTVGYKFHADNGDRARALLARMEGGQ